MEELLTNLFIKENKVIKWSKYSFNNIEFYLEDEEIVIEKACITMKELKAIIAKCKDLGWLDENEGVDRSEN